MIPTSCLDCARKSGLLAFRVMGSDSKSRVFAGEMTVSIFSSLKGNIAKNKHRIQDLTMRRNRHGNNDEELSLEAKVVQLAVEKANSAVFHVSQTQPQCRGMGTTIVASLFYNNRVSVAHIGDSRMYRYRNERLEQITKDHSFVQELIDKGLYTKEEARDSAKKNVVTRAMGVAPSVEVEVHEHEVEVGDVYLMCSDGLTDLVTDRDIERSFHELHINLDVLARHLVSLANANGGKDNISIMLTRIIKPYPTEGGLLDKIVNWFE